MTLKKLIEESEDKERIGVAVKALKNAGVYTVTVNYESDSGHITGTSVFPRVIGIIDKYREDIHLLCYIILVSVIPDWQLNGNEYGDIEINVSKCTATIYHSKCVEEIHKL